MLKISNLKVERESKTLLEKINFEINSGETYVILGHNGSGKSSLAYALMGHADYLVSYDTFEFIHNDIQNLSTFARSRAGIFLAFQNPFIIDGLQIFTFLKEINKIHNPDQNIQDLYIILNQYLKLLGLPESFLFRHMDASLSGGERKRIEILQMLLIKPKLAILDEIDSGVDFEGIQSIIKTISLFKKQSPESAILLITHNLQLLLSLNITNVHVLANGTIRNSYNDPLSIKKIAADGYQINT